MHKWKKIKYLMLKLEKLQALSQKFWPWRYLECYQEYGLQCRYKMVSLSKKFNCDGAQWNEYGKIRKAKNKRETFRLWHQKKHNTVNIRKVRNNRKMREIGEQTIWCSASLARDVCFFLTISIFSSSSIKIRTDHFKNEINVN